MIITARAAWRNQATHGKSKRQIDITGIKRRIKLCERTRAPRGVERPSGNTHISRRAMTTVAKLRNGEWRGGIALPPIARNRRANGIIAIAIIAAA